MIIIKLITGHRKSYHKIIRFVFAIGYNKEYKIPQRDSLLAMSIHHIQQKLRNATLCFLYEHFDAVVGPIEIQDTYKNSSVCKNVRIRLNCQNNILGRTPHSIAVECKGEQYRSAVAGCSSMQMKAIERSE